MGVTMATHYCGGHAMETKLTVGEQLLGCGMEQDSQPCETPMFQKKSCCETKFLSVDIEDGVDISDVLPEVNQLFLFTFVQTYFHLKDFSKEPDAILVDSSPPLPKQSKQILFQSFLI